MFTYRAMLLGFVFAGLVHPGHAAEPGPNPVKAVLEKQVADWNRGDLEGFMAGYWKSDELRFFSGSTVTTGWDATMDRYRKKYKEDGKEMGQLAFSDLEVQTLSPDAAFVRGKFKLVTTKETSQGLFTLLVKKFPEGWRIVHDHTS